MSRRVAAGFIGLALWVGAPTTVVTSPLAAVSPSGASAGATILITGDAFDPSAANNDVVFIPASGSSSTVRPLAVTTLDSTRNLRRLTVRVPDGLPIGPAALRVVNRASGEVSEGRSIDIVDIRLPEVASAQVGAAGVAVRITGSPNSKFASTSRVVFGAGVSVTSVTVESATSLVARITVSATATQGLRNPGVASPTQSAILTGGFTVTPAGPVNQPPTITMNASFEGESGTAIAFNPVIADPDGDPVVQQWNYGDGSSGTSTSHTYASAGTYPVSVTVTDGRGGSASAQATVLVTAPPPPNVDPTAVVAAPASGIAGQSISFDGSGSSDPNLDDTLEYEWQFGDGGAAATPLAAHTYLNPGTYSGSLTVRDGRGGSHTQTFQVTVAAAPLGRGVITGRVVDDLTGLPIPEAMAQLLDADGQPQATLPAVSDAQGRYRLSSVAGAARIRIARPGYTVSDIVVSVVDSRRVDPDDARLTLVNTQAAPVSSVTGGTVRHGAWRLDIPSAAFAQDRVIGLTEITPQGPARRLPLGWAPMAVVDLAAGSPPFDADVRLSLRPALMPPPEREIVAARWDDETGQWTALGTAARSDDGAELSATAGRLGQYVFAVADLPPTAPPAWNAGAPLVGVAPRPPPPNVQLTLNPAPRILFAQAGARSIVDAHATPTEPLPSGTPLLIDLAESFTFASGSSLHPNPGRRRLALLNVPDGQPNAMRVSFGVSPSRLLTPFTLREGAIDLAGRLPADHGASRGQVFGGSGGVFTAPGGERVIVPAGAAAEDIPLDLITIPATEFPLPLPTGFTLVRAFTIDLHGVALMSELGISVPFSGAIPTGSVAMLVHVADLADETRLVLSAVATVVNGSLVTTSDPFGDGAVRLPGIRREGRYALLLGSGDLGYLIGSVTDAGGAILAGALVEAGTSPITAISDGSGRYVLLAPSGNTAVRATNLANRDAVLGNAQVTGAFGITSHEISLGASPPAIVNVNPVNGATGVALGAGVTVTFSEPLDPASVTSDSVRLLLGSAVVPATLTLDPGNLAVTLRASALLQSHTQYSLSVAGTIRDTAGHVLGAPHLSTFTTIDVTPPAPPAPGTVTASIPGAQATSTIAGSAGTADPGGVVIVRNLRTNALTTLTPDADGSFGGIIAALRSDRLELTVRDAAGNETTVPMPRFSSPDGSVVVGAEGGRVEGPGGVAAEIPVGALPDGTVVRVVPIALNELPIPAPASYAFAGGVRLELGGVVPLREIDLSIAAPPAGADADAVVVVTPVPFGPSTRWTVVDRAPFVNGRYLTASPPFPGILGEGSYSFLRSTAGCLSYVAVNVQYGFNAFAVAVGVPFVFPVINVTTVVVPAPCGSTLNIQITQPDTGALIEQITAFAPPAPSVIATSAEMLTDDSTPPVVLQVNNPTGQQTRRVELTFSEAMDAASICASLKVSDGNGAEVPGQVLGCPATATTTAVVQAVFLPNVPFKLGEQYTITLTGATDLARNPIASPPFVFTPFEPRSLSLLQEDIDLQRSLNKCAGGACSTSATDQVLLGNVLFIANGTRNADEQYAVDPPRRLLAVDVSDPVTPKLIGWHATATNPRALAAIDNANVAGFQGDLVLVAGGGRVAGGELAGKLELYDVSACTQPTPVLPNCLAESLNPFKGAKFLSTPSGGIPRPGVPFEAGVPLQIDVLHERRLPPAQDTLVAYIGVVPIGVEAVDINHAFNAPFDASTNFAPDAVQYGDFTDIAVVRNRVLAVGANAVSGAAGIRVFSAQLADAGAIPPPLPAGLARFQGAARIGTAQNVIFDVDGDGNLGLAEDQDNDATTALQEIFDLAVVASGPLTDGCLGAVPCGELYVLDVSSVTSLRPGAPAVLSRIPLPGPAFAVQVDGRNRVIYVEIRGQGLAIVDLSHLQRTLQGIAVPPGAWDANADGLDDRLLRVFRRTDLFAGDLEIDTDRGLAFLNGSASGPQIVQVTSNCTDLALDFTPKPAASLPTFDQENSILVTVLNAAADRLLAAGGFANIAMLEQGSGSCFWRPDFPRGCRSFIPGTSDHDIEVFVPQAFVEEAQGILDAFMESNPPGVEKLGALSLFAVAREPFENAEILNGTPMNGGVDPAGDLAMGRQLLTLLWLLEGEYVTGRQGTMPALDIVLQRLRQKPQSGDPVFPGEPSGIPRLEGYEWSLLQEFNFFKSGAMIRIRNACGGGSSDVDVWADIARGDGTLDRSGNFDEDELAAGCQEELHVIAKAAIRSVLARLAADDDANPTILDIDRARYRGTACLTGVADPRQPPADPMGYTEKSCGSFEEYIVNVAVRSVRAGHGVFTAADLPRIFTFYCAKVGEHCANREGQRMVGSLFQNDAAANQFIADVIQFIEQVQGETFEVYITTLDNDTDPIGALPFLAGIAAVCAAHGTTISAAAPRADLRRCNRTIVRRKTNGDGTSTDAAERGGVRGFVKKNLRVRALNLAATTVDVPVAMYEGTGTGRADYTEVKRVVLSRFGGGQIRFLEDEADPDRPGKRRPMFPATFDLALLSANAPRAITFFIDPDGTVPESDRQDNGAGFFYYLLDRQEANGPTPPDRPELPTDAIEGDPLCRAGPKLSFEIRAFGAGNTDLRGARELSMKVGQTVQVMYRVTNTGSAPMENVSVRRNDLQIGGVVPEILPGRDTVFRETFAVPPGLVLLRGTATAFDLDGNTLPPAIDAIRIAGSVPPCDADIQSLDPDPNPVNSIGLPVSTVMRGGKLLRYYKIVRADGGTVADQLVTLRVVRPNGSENLYVSRTNADGLLTHVAQGDDDDPRGLAIEAAQIGAPGESARVTVERIDGVATVCPKTFTAQVVERNYSRALKAGANLEISGAVVGLNLKAKPGVGFEYKVDGDTATGDTRAAFARSLSMTSTLGVKATAAKTNVEVLDSRSSASAEVTGGLRTTFMLRDRHGFDLVNGELTNEQQLVIAHLVVGLLFNSTIAGGTGPAAPLVALALSELHEQLAGLAQHRESVGGSLGVGGRVSGELTGPKLSLEKSNIPVLKNLGLTVGADAAVDVSAMLSADAGTDLTISGEYRQEFDFKAKLELAVLEFGTDPETESRVISGAKALAKMVDGSASAVGTIKVTFVAGISPISLKRIVLSISHKKKYGLALVGQDLVDGGSNAMRTLRFTISDPRKFPRVMQAVSTLKAIDLALNGIPSQVALSPDALAEQIVELLAEADGFDETIERGQSRTIPLGAEGFRLGTGVGAKLEVKLDTLMTSTLRKGAIVGKDIYTLERYNAEDPAFPSPLAEELVQTLGDVGDFLNEYFETSDRTVKVVAAIRGLANTFGLRFSPSGTDLTINGAAEAEPFDVELRGFKYKPETPGAVTLIREPADVVGPIDGPHYGIGGFFNFASTRETLSAPAPLTIYWEPHEITGFDENTIGIYRWNQDRLDWDLLGGTIDPVADSVTVNVDRLGLYTAAPPMPSGGLGLDATYTASGTVVEPSTTVTVTSGPVMLNTGAPAADGTVFTVRALVPNASDPVSFGEILTADVDPTREGVQVFTVGGRIQYTVRLPGQVGHVLAVIHALHGTALGERAFLYERPQ